MKHTLITSEIKKKMINLREEGLSYKDISSRLDISLKTVKRHLIIGYQEHEKEVRKNWLEDGYVVTTVMGRHARYKIKNKRPKPINCELCDKLPINGNRLSWHHWNDKHLEYGLYLCLGCHKVAEATESGLPDKYLRLKEKAEKLEL